MGLDQAIPRQSIRLRLTPTHTLLALARRLGHQCSRGLGPKVELAVALGAGLEIEIPKADRRMRTNAPLGRTIRSHHPNVDLLGTKPMWIHLEHLENVMCPLIVILGYEMVGFTKKERGK